MLMFYPAGPDGNNEIASVVSLPTSSPRRLLVAVFLLALQPSLILGLLPAES